MLPTTLSLAFLVSPPTATTDLFDLLPSDAPVVIEVGDLHALASLAPEERGPWLALLQDPRLIQAVVDFVGGGDESARELRDVLSCFGEVLATVRGGAAAVSSSGMVTALEVDEGFEAAVHRMMRAAGTEPASLEQGKWTIQFDRDLRTADSTFVVADGRAYVTMGNHGAVLGLLTEVLTRVEEKAEVSPSAPRWWDAAHRGSLEHTIGCHVDLGALPLPSEIKAAAECLSPHAFVGLDLAGPDGGALVVSATLARDDLAGRFAKALSGGLDPALLLAAPPGATVVQTAKVDVLALLQASVALVGRINPDLDATGQFRRALESARAATGLDVERDLLSNLTGDLIYVQTIEGMEDLLDGNADAIAAAFPVVALELEDEEPFIELLELAEPFVGGLGGTVIEDEDAITLVVSVDGLDLTARVGDGHLLLGAHSARLVRVAVRLSEVGLDGMVDRKRYTEIEASPHGLALTLVDAMQLFEILGAALVMERRFDDGLMWMDELLAVLDEHLEEFFVGQFWATRDSVGLKITSR